MAIARLDTGGESAKKMKQHRCKLRADTEAVSEVIGMVLLLAILVTLFTLIQVSVVPDWNKKVEATEIKVSHDDMMFLPSDIEDVAIHKTPKTCTVQLGAQYPDRMIFRNPGPGAFGTLAVEEAHVPIIVTYNNDSEYTVPFNSKRITYEMSGTINSPKLVYEHGVIITDWGAEGDVTTDEQKLIANDNIYIPILNGSSLSKSAIGVESLAIKPYEYLDTLGNISTVSVTLDTDYQELWENTLLSSSVLADFSGTVEFGNDKIYINTSAVPYLKLPDQTASGPLHAGMISCTVENPDGGGDDGDSWGYGEGSDIMAMGSRVADVPSSNDTDDIGVKNIVLDVTQLDKLSGDLVTITVADFEGHWWKAEINFFKPDKITSILLRSANGISENNTQFSFTGTTEIDLFTRPKFATTLGTGGMYQDAEVGPENRLVTLVGDRQNMVDTAVIFFRLWWDAK